MSIKHENDIQSLKKRADDTDDVIDQLWRRIEELEKDKQDRRGKKPADG